MYYTGRKRKQLQISSGFKQARNMQSQPQSHSFTFQSSTVSYGGANGTYYTSSTTRKSGSNGVCTLKCDASCLYLYWIYFHIYFMIICSYHLKKVKKLIQLLVKPPIGFQWEFMTRYLHSAI